MKQAEPDTYVQNIICQEDGTFMCPRCHDYQDQYKYNVKRHLQKKKPCNDHPEYQHTTHVTHVNNTTINHDNSVHDHTSIVSNVNITNNITNNVVHLQPWNCTNHAWDEVFNKAKSLKTIEAALGCDLADPKQTLLACLRFQHLNVKAPERHNVIIRDGEMKVFERDVQPNVKKRNKWIQVGPDYCLALWDVISRRCLDFAETEPSFRAMRKQKVYDNLVQELDAIETYANNPGRVGSADEDMTDLYSQVEDAIRQFCATPPH